MEATCNWAAVLGHLEMSAVRILRDCAHSMEGAPDNQPGGAHSAPEIRASGLAVTRASLGAR